MRKSGRFKNGKLYNYMKWSKFHVYWYQDWLVRFMAL